MLANTKALCRTPKKAFLMIKGTNLLVGEEALKKMKLEQFLTDYFIENDYSPVIIPSLESQETFVDKAGPEILNTMYTFKDKGDRDICLIPEVTAIIQKMWKDGMYKTTKKPFKVFYLQRCYRYDRPQAGRYREFTQFGIEILGGIPDAAKNADKEEAIFRLESCLCNTLGKRNYSINDSVKRGLSYYVEDGFEAEFEGLGAQKQIAGGGRYDCGIGWAIGIERLLLAMEAIDGKSI